ncbi:hypothetical protein GCM10023232_01870 [Sphingosinicella ginsenosidimutans]|jgi:hypothetical protein|uniref:Uncharacterized protein n=1 Tax=Allosphingosinicella ginsenosidimutans TaxID=1176539 RepID=A0A5C6TVC0_9SPHN|nr:hypothetical protein [Sphingosinicella ginsenosidimutans]TXC64080.1 hypothetical protein FRZ32_10675 [Sphingosinicella ginsenosidimutans]
MTDFDLDRLGELWRQDPDPEEIERMRQTASALSRRARRAQIADTLGAVVACAAMVALVIINHNPKTLLVAIGVLLFLLYVFVRNRKLRETEIGMLTGTTEEMLDQSIERAEATRKRARFNLIAGPTMVPILALLVTIRGPARGILAAKFHLPPWSSWIVIGVCGVVLTIMMVDYARSHARSGDELRRLLRLREAYRSERDEAE